MYRVISMFRKGKEIHLKTCRSN